MNHEPLNAAQLLHELQVHQIELQLQNDELRRAQANLEVSRARYFDLYDMAPVGYVTLAAHGLIQETNLTAATLLGLPRRSLIKRPLSAYVAREDQDSYYLFYNQLRDSGAPKAQELRMTHQDGHQIWVQLMGTTALDGAGAPTLRLVLSDITSRKASEHQLEHMAHFDALTDLPNRLLLGDRLHQAMLSARRCGLGLAVLYIDLDGFKAINDEFGHDAGDFMLVAVAREMQSALREGDTLARLGGDEFAAVLLGLSHVAACAPLLERLLAAAAKPVLFGDQWLHVSASLGVTFYPQAQEVAGDQLLRQADQAMYKAKQTGNDSYQVFDAEKDHSVRNQHLAQQRLGRALADGELVLHYQPKVNLRTGEVVGVEALIRWQHPERGLLLPAEFLPMIESHPLATEVGEWVVCTALAQMEAWQAQGLWVAVSVNVGAHQLQQVNFVTRLRSLLACHPSVNPTQLSLEILETSALNELAYVVKVIEDCRQLGVSFALDDFGTGYSSLTYLKRLRVGLLKIDQSFVHDLLDTPDDQRILQGIMALTSAFQCQVIAEGAETVAHTTMLLQLGCELAQGYGISRPMAAHVVPGWIENFKPNPAWTHVLPAQAAH